MQVRIMNKFILLVSILTSLAFSSCLRKKQRTVITGRLMNCDGVSANVYGKVVAPQFVLFGHEIVLPFRTNQNGYFRVMYEGKHNFDEFYVDFFDAEPLYKVTGIEGQEKNIGDIYGVPFKTPLRIHLDVKNPYSQNDTLYISKPLGFYDSEWIKVPGPFESGMIGTFDDFRHVDIPMHTADIKLYGGYRSRVRYKVVTPEMEGISLTGTTFTLKPICSGEYTDVTLVIE